MVWTLTELSNEENRRYRRCPFFHTLKNSQESRERADFWRWWYRRGCSLPKENNDGTN